MSSVISNNFENHFSELTALHEGLSKAALDFQSSDLKNLRRLVAPFYSTTDSLTGTSTVRRIWLGYLRLINNLYSPLRASSFSEVLLRLVALLLVGYSSFVIFTVGILVILLVPNRVPIDSPDWRSVAWIIGCVLLSPAIFKRWMMLIFERNYHVLARAVLTLGLLVIIAMIFLLPIKYGMQLVNLNELLTFYIKNYKETLVLIAFLLPSVTFFYGCIVDASVWVVWICWGGLTTFFYFHNPFPIKQTRKLIFENTISSNGKTFKLLDIPEVELNALIKLAKANREGTDKRLVPTAIILALLQFLGWNLLMSFGHFLGLDTLWNNAVQVLIADRTFSPESFLVGIAVGLVFGLIFGVILFFFVVFTDLFSNLVAQSIILEACVFIQYQREKLRSAQEFYKNNLSRDGFWTRLGGWLDELMRL